MKAIEVDQDLILSVARKNEKAFGELFTLLKDNVYSMALAFMEDAVEAEAIVLEVFLRVWKAGDKLTEVADFNAWLYTITRNCSLTALKREALRRKREIEFFNANHEENYAEQDINGKDLQLILQAALDKLTPQQRKIFELSRLQGCDRATIAKILGIAPATVSAHLTIALNTVKTFLDKNAKNLPSITFFLLFLKYFSRN